MYRKDRKVQRDRRERNVQKREKCTEERVMYRREINVQKRDKCTEE